MRARFKRRLALTAISLMCTVGLLAAPGLTQQAAAKEVSNTKVGWISGYYVPGGPRDYGGYFQTAKVEGGSCTRVQRKSGGGVWTGNFVTSGGGSSVAQSCDPSAEIFWQITDDAKVSDTIGIRLYVYSGPNTGSYVVLCGSKDICLAMR